MASTINAATPISNASNIGRTTNDQVIAIDNNRKLICQIRTLLQKLATSTRSYITLETVDFDTSENQVMTKTIPNQIYIPKTGTYFVQVSGLVNGVSTTLYVFKNDTTSPNGLCFQSADNGYNLGFCYTFTDWQLTEGDKLLVQIYSDSTNATGFNGDFPERNVTLQAKYLHP